MTSARDELRAAARPGRARSARPRRNRRRSSRRARAARPARSTTCDCERGREVEAAGRLGQPEARIVRGDATERSAQGEDDVAPPERPARVAVQEQERRPGYPRRRSGRDGRRSRAQRSSNGYRSSGTHAGRAGQVGSDAVTWRPPGCQRCEVLCVCRRCRRRPVEAVVEGGDRCGAPGTPSACGSGRSWPGNWP